MEKESKVDNYRKVLKDSLVKLLTLVSTTEKFVNSNVDSFLLRNFGKLRLIVKTSHKMCTIKRRHFLWK